MGQHGTAAADDRRVWPGIDEIELTSTVTPPARVSGTS